MEKMMAMRESKSAESRMNGGQSQGEELTHREDYARNGDYLGRRPGDVSGRNHFDEEYFVDETENEPQNPVEAVPDQH